MYQLLAAKGCDSRECVLVEIFSKFLKICLSLRLFKVPISS